MTEFLTKMCFVTHFDGHIDRKNEIVIDKKVHRSRVNIFDRQN